MNKKGAGIHVDWAISMGLFVISLITLILLLRPGVKPLFDTSTLLNLVEERFNTQTLWHVRMTPLHVYKLDCESCKKEGEPTPEMTVNVKKALWSYSLVKEPKVKTFDYRFNFEQPSGRNFDLFCRSGICETQQQYPFILVTHQDRVKEPAPIFEVDCQPNDKSRCSGILGSSEDYEGYNLNWINKIINDQKTDIEYDLLKINWSYPSTSDFAIHIQGAGLDQNIMKSPEPPAQANVQAKLVRGWILKDDGSRENITISFRVW